MTRRRWRSATVSETIIRRVKWSYKCLLERRGLKMPRFFKKFEKPPFPDLFPVNRCVNDVTRVCHCRIEAALPPTLTTHSSKTRRRMDFGWWHFLWSKTAQSTVKVSFDAKVKLSLLKKSSKNVSASTPSSVCEKRRMKKSGLRNHAWREKDRGTHVQTSGESLCQVEVEAAQGSERIEGRNEKRKEEFMRKRKNN